MPIGESLVKFEVDNSVAVHTNKEFFTSFTHMLIATRRIPEEISPYEIPMLHEAMKRENVMPEELYEAFWKAYRDPYVPNTGIEWRHLWKHIEESRNVSDLYTYDEMAQICDRDNLPREAFEFVDSIAEAEKEKNPDVNLRYVKIWRRK